MSYQERIKAKLTKAFSPIFLEVRDDSAKHEGHAGSHPDGETHFHVTIHAAAFNGMSRVARQRTVYKVLAEELEGHVHALALKVSGVDE